MRFATIPLFAISVLLLAGACTDRQPRGRSAAAPYLRAPLDAPARDCTAAPLYAAAVNMLGAVPGADQDFWSGKSRREAIAHPASWASAPANLRALVAEPAAAHVVALAAAAANCRDGHAPAVRPTRYMSLGRFLQARAIAEAHAGHPGDAARTLTLAIQLGGDLTRGAPMLETFAGWRLETQTLELTAKLADLGLLDAAATRQVTAVAERVFADLPAVPTPFVAVPLAASLVCHVQPAASTSLCSELAISDRVQQERLAARSTVAALQRGR